MLRWRYAWAAVLGLTLALMIVAMGRACAAPVDGVVSGNEIPAADSVNVHVQESPPASTLAAESRRAASELTRCAGQLRALDAQVAALPPPANRTWWLTSGLAAGFVLGALSVYIAEHHP